MSLNSPNFLDWSPAPKPDHKRSRSRSDRAEFPAPVRQQVFDYFRGKCAECRRPGSQIHHIRFRSQEGRGVFTNGLLLCHECHTLLHKTADLWNKWQFWAEKKYGPNYYKDEDDLRGEKSYRKTAAAKKKKKKGIKKKWPSRPFKPNVLNQKWPKKRKE